MPLGDFVKAGTTPRPLPIGRISRFAFGLGAAYFFVWNLQNYADRVSGEFIDTGYLVGAGFALWYLSDAFTVGFGLRWGRWPQIGAITIAVILAGASLVADDSVWGPPLAWGVFIMTQFFFGFIAPSFLLAAIFAVPG